MKIFLTALLLISFYANDALSYNKPFYMEVLNVEGDVTAFNKGEKRNLLQGGVLYPEEVVKVGEASLVDLALDKSWKNTIRLEENTKVFVKSLFPTGFHLTHGSILAKLDGLPKESTFEIQTPSLLVGARGTAFVTSYKNEEEDATVALLTDESKLFVFGMTKNHQLRQPPIIVTEKDCAVYQPKNSSKRPPECKAVPSKELAKYHQSLGALALTVEELSEKRKKGQYISVWDREDGSDAEFESKDNDSESSQDSSFDSIDGSLDDFLDIVDSSDELDYDTFDSNFDDGYMDGASGDGISDEATEGGASLDDSIDDLDGMGSGSGSTGGSSDSTSGDEDSNDIATGDF